MDTSADDCCDDDFHAMRVSKPFFRQYLGVPPILDVAASKRVADDHQRWRSACERPEVGQLVSTLVQGSPSIDETRPTREANHKGIVSLDGIVRTIGFGSP